MSVILDALKKLDREKSLRRSGTANIAVEILKPDLPRPEKRMKMSFVIVTATALATAALTYAVVEFRFLSKSSPPAIVTPRAPSQQVAPRPNSGIPLKSSLPPSMNPPVPSQQISPAPLHSSVLSKSSPPVSANPPTPNEQAAPASPNSSTLPKSSTPAALNPPVPSQQVVPASVPREPANSVRDEVNRVPLSIESPVEGKTPAASFGEEETGKNVLSEKAKLAPRSAEPSAEPASVKPAATPPLLRLSAIVWHEEPSKRIAMINGIMTNEGSVIEGVKIEEIQTNRVRLSHNGRAFEISLR